MNILLQDPQLVIDEIINAVLDNHPPMWYFPGKAAQFMRYYVYLL